jgi:AAA15 family ATPase/GTPase
MITSVEISNLKGIKNQKYEFTSFDLIVGRNNSGKSTILQALSIWNYCVQEFKQNSKKAGDSGIQIILPNFSPIPLSEYKLLWSDLIERKNIMNENGNRQPELIFIEITVNWTNNNVSYKLGIQLRYSSNQSLYAKPINGWVNFHQLNKENCFPIILYVPPFSGLLPQEERKDVPVILKTIGGFQPGSVIRNILLKSYTESSDTTKVTKIEKAKWREFKFLIESLFNIAILPPVYQLGKDTYIDVKYSSKSDTSAKYNLIAAGSGFHQSLILLGFIQAFNPDVILYDEPDAHLHASLQTNLLNHFIQVSNKNGTQFLIATHSEVFINGVNDSSIICLREDKSPSRTVPKSNLVNSLSLALNDEITFLTNFPRIIYVEGDDDMRIIKKWATILGYQNKVSQSYFKILGGGSFEDMSSMSQKHFLALKAIIGEQLERIMIFDRDNNDKIQSKESLFIWNRYSIDNYFAVENVWKRSLLKKIDQYGINNLREDGENIISDFFKSERLDLREGEDPKTFDNSILRTVNLKDSFFVREDSLFQRLRGLDERIVLNRELLSANFLLEEIHQDVEDFFQKFFGENSLANFDLETRPLRLTTPAFKRKKRTREA